MNQETIDDQNRDSNIIFTAISTASYESFEEANRAVVMLYVPDMTVSRSGISHALKRLEQHYSIRSSRHG